METFGSRFGRLVRDKRGIEGWSQDKLSARTELTKSRISELEAGKVKNPQAKTVDALCVALNISREERESCHALSHPNLPHLLLENLALRFGYSNPGALEGNLSNFLRSKASEYQAMRERLARMDAIDNKITAFLADAKDALERGDFEAADACLAGAEAAQLEVRTLPALNFQYELRFERGNAALIAGEVTKAAWHWEEASNYYHSLAPRTEAETRYEHCMLLRAHAYKYKDAQALHEAELKAKDNLLIWTEEDNLDGWCKTMIALGGIRWRLAQFDNTPNFGAHLAEAKSCYEAVRERTSPSLLPRYHAQACGNLANIYSERDYAASAHDYYENIGKSLQFQKLALPLIEKKDQPEEWGILHHNMGLTYIRLFEISEYTMLQDIDSGIRHLESSFEVRSFESTFQYWIASYRSLGEALIKRAMCPSNEDAPLDLEKAFQKIHAALSRISKDEHPNQWEQLHQQLRLHSEQHARLLSRM